ncbi:MAG: stage II sporulation protein M [Prevotella sp.]|nr:stage II sporulation protein M [Prevotella sp.]
MKEAVFIRKNIAKWRAMEVQIGNMSNTSPDKLVDTYAEVNADLAFAQTHYPHSRITEYLNNMAVSLHGELYQRKNEKWSRLLTFWTHEVPTYVYEGRRCILLSLAILLLGVVVGAVSALGGDEFVRSILGDGYVEMTADNIRSGQPFGVYASEESSSMFLGIMMNNVWVSFLYFVMGVFTSIATGYFIFYNGMMVGAFVAYFAQHGLFGPCLLTLFLHGTLELSALVVAGGAGIALGNGWLFPGTYSRIESFKRSAKRGVKILVSTTPIFVVAAFIEGFFTRLTEAGDALRLTVIVLSALFILFYYVYLPIHRHRHGTTK